jgi:ParB family transcriptional regulator, chromosome partitioning protein
MNTKFKGLGRGLDALLSGSGNPEMAKDVQRTLTVDRLQPGKYQPRTRMDPATLDELAASIRAQGLIQPILVRPIGNERYEIVAGERRWRASQVAGLREVPVLVREIPDEAALAMALIENIQREDLNPLEEAMGLQRLIDEFSMTHQQAAEAVGRSRSAASNLLRLLQLPAPVQDLLLENKLDMGHARALLPLPGSEQVAVANRAASQQLSVRQVEQLVQRMLQEAKGSPQATHRPENRDLIRLQEELSDLLGAAVRVQHSKGGRGKLLVPYDSLEQLDGILNRMGAGPVGR